MSTDTIQTALAADPGAMQRTTPGQGNPDLGFLGLDPDIRKGFQGYRTGFAPAQFGYTSNAAAFAGGSR